MVRRIGLLSLLLATQPAWGQDRLVLVVGNNQPAETGQALLHYADDDAIRYYERFAGLSSERVVLTRLDEESRIYKALYPGIPAPTRANLERAANDLKQRATSLVKHGRAVEIVFVFAGHGGTRGGVPYLALEDGALTLDELEGMLLRDQPARLVHMVIDACNAAAFIEGRGPMRGKREPLPQGLEHYGGLAARYPNVGFILASSSGGSAYEWSRYGSGVASHLILSALSGAADLGPSDGRITYDEIDAFLRVATADVLASEYRQELLVLPPRAEPSAAIIDFNTAVRGTTLLVDRPGRYYLRDADAQRIADFHHGKGTLPLLLPIDSPRFQLVRVSPVEPACLGPAKLRPGECVRQEQAFAVPTSVRQVRLDQLRPERVSSSARGMVEDSVFEQLFARPFEAEDVASLTAPGDSVTSTRTPLWGLSVAYRGTWGELEKEQSWMNGADLRLQRALTDRLILTPSLGYARGTATPTEAPKYPISQMEAGVEVAFFAWKRLVAAGLEARYQLQIQEPPGEAQRLASVGQAGGVLRGMLELSQLVELEIGIAAGLRVGSVENHLRARPYLASFGGAGVRF